MAASGMKRVEDIMETPEGHGERAHRDVNQPAKGKNTATSRLSPYANICASQRQERKTSFNINPRAVPRTSKTKNIHRSPSHKPTCASAPATTVRVAGERQTATNASLKAKQGACSINLGVPRKGRSASLILPHHQKHATYMMVPVRLKKAGLKLLDPEKVKNLASLAAAKTFQSGIEDGGSQGEDKLHSRLPQAHANKQCSLNFRHRAVLRFPAKQMTPSRKSTGIPGRWPDQSKRNNKTSGDHESHLLTQQLDGLVLSDIPESSSPHSREEPYNSQISTHSISNQKVPSKNDKKAGTDGRSIDETSNTEPLEILTVQTRSTTKEEILLDIVNKNVKKEDLDFRTSVAIQGQHLGGDMDSNFELPLSIKENHETDGLKLVVKSNNLTQTQVDALSNPQKDACTKSQCQEDTIASHDQVLKESPKVKTESQQIITTSHDSLAKSPRTNNIDSANKRCASFPSKEDPSQHNSIDIGQSSRSSKETIEEKRAYSSREDTESNFSSRKNDIIRRSQGVLVLTKSTDENAIFIPKLKFEFTPDNSIDWTALPQLMTNNQGDQNREKDPNITKPYTPRGPSFSKSVLKKFSAFQGHIATESIAGSIGAEMSTKDSCLPLHEIVDLSISFQGKYAGDEIPNDIPKISLVEGDSDED